MNDTTNFSNEDFKHIIDPKSGFSLYLKEFKDSSIYQVSTEKTFPIPQNLNDTISDNSQIKSNLKEEIQSITENQKEINTQSRSTINAIIKTNNQLTYIIYSLVALFIFSVFF